ncbi:hypothetical protein GCM10028796_05000 [Ramlibacter monticola]
MVVNGLAALLMTAAAMLVPAWMTQFYPAVLTWVPVAGFWGAALAGLRLTPGWQFLALALNAASVLVVGGFGLLAVSYLDIARLGLPFAVPAAALAGWNVYRLSAESP